MCLAYVKMYTPFIGKPRFFDAVLMSALLYGCEPWMCVDVETVVKLYNGAIKELLGVREPTPNLMCHAEFYNPSLPDLAMNKQHTFYNYMW